MCVVQWTAVVLINNGVVTCAVYNGVGMCNKWCCVITTVRDVRCATVICCAIYNGVSKCVVYHNVGKCNRVGLCVVYNCVV
jgi:hypothetical protein